MVQLKELWLAGRSSGAGDKKTVKAAGEAVIKVERRIIRVLCVHRHIVSVFLLWEKGLGLNFKIIDSKLDESNIKFKRPHLYCQKLANMKANLVLEKNPNSLVIGADTIVYVDNKILEKP